jgi:hypothetical protein
MRRITTSGNPNIKLSRINVRKKETSGWAAYEIVEMVKHDSPKMMIREAIIQSDFFTSPTAHSYQIIDDVACADPVALAVAVVS